MKKILLLILIFISPLILDSCLSVSEEAYVWVDMEAYNFDHFNSIPQISNSDSIQTDIYGIRVEFIDSLYAYNSFNTNQLYAITPPYKYVRKNNINSIHIFTVFELTNEYDANTDVTDLFRFREMDINHGRYFRNSEITPIINADDTSFGREGFDSFLFTDLAINRLCKFRIEVELSNNKTLSYETQEVFLY